MMNELVRWVEAGGAWECESAPVQVDDETVRVAIRELCGRHRRGTVYADPRYIAETAEVRWAPWTGDLG